MLSDAVAITLSLEAGPFSILEAYGLADYTGVVPIALVHSNRMPQETAATLGTFYDYPGEPLSGTNRPCPPGPGLPERWMEQICDAWIWAHIPLSYYGASQWYKYREAREQGQRTPSNHYAQDLVWQLQKQMLLTGHMGDRISNKDVISSGPLRIMFAYRSNADEYSAQMVRCDPDPDGSELLRDGPCTTVRQMLSVDDRPDLESVARATSVTSTINKAIGDTQNVVIAMLENNTRWTAQENLFLVAASRARQSTIFFGDYNYFSRRASARVRGCLQTLEARNMVIRPQVWGWDWSSLPCVRVATQVWAIICERAAQRDRGDPTGSRAADAFAASAAEVKAALEFRRVQSRAHCEKDPRTVPRTRGSPEVFGNPSVVIERDDDSAGGEDDDMEGVPTVPLEAPLDRSLSLQAWMAIRAGHVDRDVVRAAMVNTPPEHQWVDVRFSELGSLVKLLSYVDHRERIETYLARFIALAVKTIQVCPDTA